MALFVDRNPPVDIYEKMKKKEKPRVMQPGPSIDYRKLSTVNPVVKALELPKDQQDKRIAAKAALLQHSFARTPPQMNLSPPAMAVSSVAVPQYKDTPSAVAGVSSLQEQTKEVAKKEGLYPLASKMMEPPTMSAHGSADLVTRNSRSGRNDIITSNSFGDGSNTKYSIGGNSITVHGDSKIRDPLNQEGKNGRGNSGLSVMFNSSVPQESRDAFMRTPFQTNRTLVQSEPKGIGPRVDAANTSGPVNTFSDIIREKARQSNLKNDATVKLYGAEADKAQSEVMKTPSEIMRNQAITTQGQVEVMKTVQEMAGNEEEIANTKMKRRMIALQQQNAEVLTNAPPVPQGLPVKDAILAEIENRKKNKLLPIQ